MSPPVSPCVKVKSGSQENDKIDRILPQIDEFDAEEEHSFTHQNQMQMIDMIKVSKKTVPKKSGNEHIAA